MIDFDNDFHQRNVHPGISVVPAEGLLLSYSHDESDKQPYLNSTGSKTWSALASSIHRFRIREGNYLEIILGNLALERLNLSVDFVFDSFIQGKIPNSKSGNFWFISKHDYKTYLRPYLCRQTENVCPKEWARMKNRHMEVYKRLGLDFEPDAIILDPEKKIFYAIELKLGVRFDKGKSQSVSAYLEKNATSVGVLLPYLVQSRVCSFDADTLEEAYSAFHGKVEKKYCITGQQICSMLGIQKSDVLLTYEKARQENLDFCNRAIVDRGEGLDEILLERLAKPENRQRLRNLLERMTDLEQKQRDTELVVASQFANVEDVLLEKLPA